MIDAKAAKKAARLEIKAEAVSTIVRFTQNDWPTWGEWLIGRLSDAYPTVARGGWLMRLIPCMSANDFLFIRNTQAVLLVGGQPRFLTGREIIMECFAFSRAAVRDAGSGQMKLPHLSQEEGYLVSLYRYAREWARSRRAERFFVGQMSDIWPNRLIDALSNNAKKCDWVSYPL